MDFVYQRPLDPTRLHDVWLLANIRRCKRAHSIQRIISVFIHRTCNQPRSLNLIDFSLAFSCSGFDGFNGLLIIFRRDKEVQSVGIPLKFF
jgi:hypothetical protein